MLRFAQGLQSGLCRREQALPDTQDGMGKWMRITANITDDTYIVLGCVFVCRLNGYI